MSNIVITPTTAAATTVTPSTNRKTFGALVDEIQATFGMQYDSARRDLIKDYVKGVIDELNMKLWRFNLIKAADITTSAGTASYSVPTDLWAIYSIRKANDIDFTVTTVEQRSFDIMFASQNNITGYPYANVVFNIFRDGTITLFPTPDAIHTMTLRYFKQIPHPAADSDYLDMPAAFQVVVKHGAMARTAALAERPVAMADHERKYQDLLMQMKQRDEDPGDVNLRFINTEELEARSSNYMNPALRPRYLDFW